MQNILLITGASRGIGAETARLAVQAGYDICINYLNSESAAQELVEFAQAQGQQAIAVRADVSVEAEVISMFQTIDSQLGRLSALVNNVGILETQSTLEHFSFDRLQRVFNTNIIGSFLCAREAIKRMSTSHGGKGGTIVNLSSRASVIGSPNEYIDYAASKGAIDSMTIGLASEVGNQGIRVNAVRPGLIYTDIHASGGEAGRVDRLKSKLPLQRGGLPIEVARAIMWLLSDESSYTTGGFIEVSGGR